MTRTRITVVGAGVTGLWQALTLARAGHAVTLVEQSAAAAPFAAAASRCAGGMLAPYCEEEAAPAIVRQLGLEGIALWRGLGLPGLVTDAGSLVVAAARDLPDLRRFARMTTGHQLLDAAALAEIEPALQGRFSAALHFAGEAHVASRVALSALLAAVHEAGATVAFGRPWSPEDVDPAVTWTIDCRGIAARDMLPGLRGVRGEMAVIRSAEVTLRRPVRLLHPRTPLYAVPWTDGRIMLGASVIERGDAGPVTVRAALDLLGAAYALSPVLAEAELAEVSAGVRPAFADNVPRIIARGHQLFVNGMYRHGFLLAPVLADHVARYIASGSANPQTFAAS
jgi:glycine oxidase